MRKRPCGPQSAVSRLARMPQERRMTEETEVVRTPAYRSLRSPILPVDARLRNTWEWSQAVDNYNEMTLGLPRSVW